jgi:CheY-specific phosphatase CheX
VSNADHPLRKASLKVLETWGMMIVDEVQSVDASLFDPNEPVFMSWVNLDGAMSGAVSIVAQADFLKTLAVNVLGDEEASLDGPACQDAFRELGNILAGNFLTEAYGEKAVFDLLHPNVTEVPFSDVEKFTQRNIVFAFLADEKPVAVTFSTKKASS